MRAIIQRVSTASVTIDQKLHTQIAHGLLILLGIEAADTQEDIDWLAQKIIKMRIFDDANGVMNLSAEETSANLLIVSQFTLHASTKKGNRPSYIKAAKPEISIPLYQQFVQTMENLCPQRVQTGVFGANMQVNLCNDGPVTIFIDTKNKE